MDTGALATIAADITAGLAWREATREHIEALGRTVTDLLIVDRCARL